MEGSNLAGRRQLDANLFGVISELRTPLVEVLAESQRLGDKRLLVVTTNALKLFDGYLLMQKIASGMQLDYQPSSLAAEVEDIYQDTLDLADVYGINLDLKLAKLRQPTSLNRNVFRYAMHGLLYASLTSLQNKPGAKLRLEVKNQAGPKLKLFSPDLEIIKRDYQSVKFSKQAFMPGMAIEGAQSGLVIATKLFETTGKGLNFTSNQYGKGFIANFVETRQMKLVESLA